MSIGITDKFNPELLDPEKCNKEIAERWIDYLLNDINWISNVNLEFLLVSVFRLAYFRHNNVHLLVNLKVGIKRRNDVDSIEKEMLIEAINLLTERYKSSTIL